MNSKDYISSGIIESFVLGLASVEEQEQLFRMAQQNPDIAEALRQAELKFERIGLQNAMPPPQDTWAKIHQSMEDLRMQERPAENNPISDARHDDRRIPPYTVINVQNPNNRIIVHKYWRPVFILVFILSKIFLALALFYYFENDKVKSQNEQLKLQLEQLSGK